MKNLRILEKFPERINARLEHREHLRRTMPKNINGAALELVMEDLKLWRIGMIKVSFKGGTKALHKKIADTASTWSTYANIKFDFGYSTRTRAYRKWKVNDQSHIRIGFAEEGYWSLVGTDSKDPLIAAPGEITMNFEGFDRALPGDWQGTVLHEFGHALGFHHEHQSPAAGCDFDWDKLYQYLSGPPNYWSKAVVDHNLAALKPQGLTYSPHDIHSIMHYSFDEWMFKAGAQSQCYTPPNHVLSAEDKAMAGNAYPFKRSAFEAIDKKRRENLTAMIKMDRPQALRETDKTHLEFLQKDTSYKKLLRD